MRLRLPSLLLTVMACASSPPPAAPVAADEAVPVVVPVVTPVHEPEPVPAGMDIAVVCAGMDPAAPVRVRVEDAVLECPGGRLDSCRGETRFFFANCGDEPVTLRGAELVDHGGQGRVTFDFDDREIAAGGIWPWTRRAYFYDASQLRVDVVDSRGAPIPVAEQPVRTSHPTRDAAIAACVACNGVWGVHGLMAREGCNCQARDALKKCRDGDECEGACIFDRWEVSQPALPGGCTGKGQQRACTARTRALGRPVGRCSGFIGVRSCHNLIRRGISSQPDQQIPWGTSRVCSSWAKR